MCGEAVVQVEQSVSEGMESAFGESLEEDAVEAYGHQLPKQLLKLMGNGLVKLMEIQLVRLMCIQLIKLLDDQLVKLIDNYMVKLMSN